MSKQPDPEYTNALLPLPRSGVNNRGVGAFVGLAEEMNADRQRKQASPLGRRHRRTLRASIDRALREATGAKVSRRQRATHACVECNDPLTRGMVKGDRAFCASCGQGHQLDDDSLAAISATDDSSADNAELSSSMDPLLKNNLKGGLGLLPPIGPEGLDEGGGDADALEELDQAGAQTLRPIHCPPCGASFLAKATADAPTSMSAKCSSCDGPLSHRDLHLTAGAARRLADAQRERMRPRGGRERRVFGEEPVL